MTDDGPSVDGPDRCILRIGAESERVVRDYLGSQIDRELGGFLLGRTHTGCGAIDTTIEEAIPCPEAIGDLSRLTFTPECWQRVHCHPRIRADEAAIVGWFHSHPGMPTRMSGRDEWIQRMFFDAPFFVAWIRDPIGDVDSWWRWVGDAPAAFNEVHLDGHRR